MSLIKMAPHVALVVSRALAGLAVAAIAVVGLSRDLAAEPELGIGSVFTADEKGASISRIDLQSGNVKSIGLSITPHNVDLTTKGRLVFVVGTANDGNGDMSSDADGSTMLMAMEEEDEPGGEEPAGRLVVLDMDGIDQGPVAMLDVGHHPAHVVPDLDGERVFVTDSELNLLSVVDLAERKVVKTIPTGRYPHGLRLSPDGQELFVANVEDGSVSVIDVGSLTETARIPVGMAPVQVGFTPDGTRIYVSLRDEDKVAVIDRATRRVVATVAVGRKPIQVYVTPDGRFVYVANQGSDVDPDNRVSIIEVARNEVVKTLTVGAGAHGVAISNEGRFAYVTNINDDTVSVIDVLAQTVIRTIPVGKGPNGIAVLSGS